MHTWLQRKLLGINVEITSVDAFVKEAGNNKSHSYSDFDSWKISPSTYHFEIRLLQFLSSFGHSLISSSVGTPFILLWRRFIADT